MQPVSASLPLEDAGPAGATRLGTVIVIVSSGLFLQCLGDTLARQGHQAAALPLFFSGLVIIFAPCAWRLTSSDATRSERLHVSLVLGVGLLASYVIRSPLIFDGFDELLHLATLTRLIDTRTLFATNTELPVSPYYPGLELLTIATKWVTGLPLELAQLLVLVAARIVLVLAVFLVTERVCNSAKAGGIAVLVYAASPQFYSFNSQYAYQTLALAFASGVVYLLGVSVDQPEPQTGRPFVLSLGCIGALTITHHLTSWLTVALLLIGAVGLLAERRRAEARVVGLAAAVALVAVTAWTALVGNRLFEYLSPIFKDAVTSLESVIGKLHGNRQLFHNAAGGVSPRWEIAVMLAAAGLWCLMLVPAALAAIRDRSLRGGALRFVPVVAAVAYPFALLTSLSSESAQVGARATTFIFFGMSVVIAAWLSPRLSGHRRLLEQVGTIAVAVVCFLGGMMFGSGPDWSYVPGPYLVGADARSVSPASLTAAEWVSTHLVVGSHIAVDRDNGALLNAIGHVEPVTAISRLVNVSPLFFDPRIGPYEISLIRKAGIRYILIDLRLLQGLPLFGTYIEPGETPKPQRLTFAELNKWNSVPGARRIYDDGPIRIYDLASILELSPTAPPSGPVDGARGTRVDWLVLLAATLTGGVWLVRLRRRRRRIRLDEQKALFWLLAAMAAGVFGAFMLVPSTLPARPVGLAVLAVLLAMGLLPSRTSAEATKQVLVRAPGKRRSVGEQLALACAGVALIAVGGSYAVAAARREWVPPAQLALLYTSSGRGVVTVNLGSRGPIVKGDSLEVTIAGEVVWTHALSRTTATQTIVLPRTLPLLETRVLVISDGKTLRAVDG